MFETTACGAYQVEKPITLKQLNGPITVVAKATMPWLNGFSYSFKQLYSRTLLLAMKTVFCKQTKYEYEDSLPWFSPFLLLGLEEFNGVMAYYHVPPYNVAYSPRGFNPVAYTVAVKYGWSMLPAFSVQFEWWYLVMVVMTNKRDVLNRSSTSHAFLWEWQYFAHSKDTLSQL